LRWGTASHLLAAGRHCEILETPHDRRRRERRQLVDGAADFVTARGRELDP
jgi:hypothetical protein